MVKQYALIRDEKRKRKGHCIQRKRHRKRMLRVFCESDATESTKNSAQLRDPQQQQTAITTAQDIYVDISASSHHRIIATVKQTQTLMAEKGWPVVYLRSVGSGALSISADLECCCFKLPEKLCATFATATVMNILYKLAKMLSHSYICCGDVNAQRFAHTHRCPALCTRARACISAGWTRSRANINTQRTG